MDRCADLPAAEAMGFQMYANHTSVSHAYAHITEFGEPVVEIDSFKIADRAICCMATATEW